MITRVVDASGTVLHDCTAAGCQVSWDGYVIGGSLDATTGGPAGPDTPPADVVKAGERMPGATDPDPALWRVDGSTAHQLPQG